MKPIVMLDVDGVVANFTELYIRCANKALGWNLDTDFVPTEWAMHRALGLDDIQHLQVDKELYKPGKASDMQFLPGAKEAVFMLAEYAEVYFVTSHVQESPTWVHDRDEWLHNHFGELGGNIIHTHHKYICKGELLLDDKPSHVEAYNSRYGYGAFLWTQPYNESVDAPRFRTWHEVYEHVKKLRG